MVNYSDLANAFVALAASSLAHSTCQTPEGYVRLVRMGKFELL